MPSNTSEGRVVRVSKKGQTTIPKQLRERFEIDTPGRVFIYEDDGKIVVEPVPSVKDMQGIHAGQYEKGEVLAHLREMVEQEKELEQEQQSYTDVDRRTES